MVDARKAHSNPAKWRRKRSQRNRSIFPFTSRARQLASQTVSPGGALKSIFAQNASSTGTE